MPSAWMLSAPRCAGSSRSARPGSSSSTSTSSMEPARRRSPIGTSLSRAEESRDLGRRGPTSPRTAPPSSICGATRSCPASSGCTITSVSSARPNLAADGSCDGPSIQLEMTFSAPRLYLANGVTTIRTDGQRDPVRGPQTEAASRAGTSPVPAHGRHRSVPRRDRASIKCPGDLGPEDARRPSPSGPIAA